MNKKAREEYQEIADLTSKLFHTALASEGRGNLGILAVEYQWTIKRLIIDQLYEGEMNLALVKSQLETVLENITNKEASTC